MTVEFRASRGVVDYYNVTVDRKWSVETFSNKANFTLKNGRRYGYSITAYRRGNASNIRKGKFVTIASKFSILIFDEVKQSLLGPLTIERNKTRKEKRLYCFLFCCDNECHFLFGCLALLSLAVVCD